MIDIQKTENISLDEIKKLIGDLSDPSFFDEIKKQSDNIAKARDMFADIKNHIDENMFAVVEDDDKSE